ncbi:MULTISPECIES: IS66 family transposase [Roseomonadaceae]|uniref:IS66 family transposase n=1 Tax=Falsiroseomonas oleicola TaxID=2801474 RepID=A0ABS6H6L4_9PROT|nr:IS66 family transposase [Roseomonas oleicola]MBU8544339.1 IS66 family transposase [Roseomonas oleicola]
MHAASFDTPDAEIAALRALLAERDAVLAERDAELRNATFEIEKLKVQLATLRRDRYGKSSEKLAIEIGQLEMLIGDAEEDQAQAAARAEAKAGTKGQPGNQRRPALRKPLPEHLPRETILHEPVFACRCGCTDPKRLTRLGEDVTEVLEKIPARLKVIRHVRPRYACRACEAVLQAPAPDLPIEKGRPGPGLLAHVLVSKYLDGLPLYRLSAILAREGVEIERQTLADWVGRGAWWLSRLAEAIGAYALRHGIIWTDDTPIAVLAPGRGRTREGRFWVYAIDPRPWKGHGPPAAFYRYSPDRKGERPRGHLEDFEGWLHADGYTGYDALARPRGNQPPQVIHVACWAHARRKLFEVFEATKSPIAEEALKRIAGLYAIEAEINGKPADQRRAERQARSKPLVDDLHDWMLTQRRRLSGKSTLGKAMQYALNRWEALARYLEDGRLSIDNNLAERLLRGIALARKNFLFLGSDAGGDRAAIIYTVAETAKLNGLDPEAYIAAVLDRLARGHTIDRLDELLPWNFAPAPSPAGTG